MQQIGSSDDLPVLLHDRRIVSVFDYLASRTRACQRCSHGNGRPRGRRQRPATPATGSIRTLLSYRLMGLKATVPSKAPDVAFDGVAFV